MPRPDRKTLRGTSTERNYYAWLEGLPCCLTGRTDGVQYAHTGNHKQGKGMGRKASLTTVLPIHYVLHGAEERGRTHFWMGVGLDPVVWAERLFDCFEKRDRESAEVLLMDMQKMADRDYLAMILRRAA